MLTTQRHYRIIFPNGSTYYGRTTQSGNKRYKSHLNKSKLGKHENKHIQEAYNKYGYMTHEWLGTETGDLEHHNNIEFGYIQSDPKSLNIRDGSWGVREGEYHRQREQEKIRTPEEREEYNRYMREYQSKNREKRNSKARERYHKLKQKNEVI